METIQVALESELLRAANAAAKRARVNRSALIRQALREYLRGLRTREAEARNQRGYRDYPETPGEVAFWERVALWPQR